MPKMKTHVSVLKFTDEEDGKSVQIKHIQCLSDQHEMRRRTEIFKILQLSKKKREREQGLRHLAISVG